MYPVVKAILDGMCCMAKSEMKEIDDDKLGSWKSAVTCADGTWLTRGFKECNIYYKELFYWSPSVLYASLPAWQR